MVRQPILGVFDDPGDTESSGNLPPVRSQSKRYYSGWDPKLIRLTGDYLFKLNRDTYARASAGILERAFAGVERRGAVEAGRAELGPRARGSTTWRSATPTARSASATTTTRWRPATPRSTGTPAGTASRRSSRPAATSPATGAARVAVSRRFANGWAVGAYATKTDVTAEDFGEGSFAKGLTLSIPLRWATPFETRQTIDGNLTSLGEQRRRVPEHPEPPLPDRARPRPQPPGAELGSILAMKRLLALLRCAALAACGSGGKDPIVQAAIEEFGRLLGARGPVPTAPPRVVTRADIVRADVAAIQARLEADASPTLMYAAASNGGYVTYVSALQQQIILRGAQIAGTRGLGTDLLSAWTRDARPAGRARCRRRAGRRGVRRVYELPAEGPRGEIVTFDCYFEPPVPAEMTILQVRYQGVQIPEICAGPSGGFENLHFVDSSGAVWRSLQWVGPKMDLVDLQILEPYTGD